ncbi:MAG: LuxR C-terminal-related transcriptional regulator [Fimbriimonas sp.]|nr:LuxR C-terminal-related transcriptional regulator [Fimbriimonas sp.]
MSDIIATGEAPKREEQVLVLAAGGLTDKEIAIKLGISPDTVGTYWRRILAKYQAASRTEVVAKYAEDRSKAAVENLQYVNECLKLVADYMIANAGRSPVASPTDTPTSAPSLSLGDSILAIVSDWILLLDNSGKIVFSNKPVRAGCKISELVSNDDLVEILELASKTETDTELDVIDSAHSKLESCYSFRLWPGVHSLTGHIVGIGRAF